MSDDNFERLRVVPRAERDRHNASSYESQSRFDIDDDDFDDEDGGGWTFLQSAGPIGYALIAIVLLLAVAVGGFALGVSYESLHANN